MWVIFALLDPDTYSDLIESGSNPDPILIPDPKHWFSLSYTVHLTKSKFFCNGSNFIDESMLPRSVFTWDSFKYGNTLQDKCADSIQLFCYEKGEVGGYPWLALLLLRYIWHLVIGGYEGEIVWQLNGSQLHFLVAARLLSLVPPGPCLLLPSPPGLLFRDRGPYCHGALFCLFMAQTQLQKSRYWSLPFCADLLIYEINYWVFKQF